MQCFLDGKYCSSQILRIRGVGGGVGGGGDAEIH